MAKTSQPLYERPAELLQQLIRINTTNPPGNELACIQFLNDLLKQAGFETTVAALSPGRPNLVTRLKGTGQAPPLLLYAHVDVVPTENQAWTVPPFEGRIVDGFVWGRGAFDNKHAVTMYLCALLRARAEGLALPGDVLFAATADEEAGSTFGARYLVEQRPELFEGVRYALSEFGGFNLSLAGRRFYPIQVAEKLAAPLRMTFRGSGGHGALPVRGGAMAGLARALGILDRTWLPVHITPAVRLAVEALADGLGGASGLAIRQLLRPGLTDAVLRALGKRAVPFTPLLHHTVSPTMLEGSSRVNVIPSQVSLGLDGRVLPGYRPADLVAELQALLGEQVEIELVGSEPVAAAPAPEMGLFHTLSDILTQADPSGRPIPFVGSWITDARFFNRLGIQTYGFTPLQVPEDLDLASLSHAADERIPVQALEFGVRAVTQAIQRFH